MTVNGPLGKPTPISHQCAIYASLGLNNKQIADAIGRSEDTVKTHLKRFFAANDISSRAKLPGYFLSSKFYTIEHAGDPISGGKLRMDMLRMVAAGKSNQQIASTVGTSEDDVKQQNKRVYGKRAKNALALFLSGQADPPKSHQDAGTLTEVSQYTFENDLGPFLADEIGRLATIRHTLTRAENPAILPHKRLVRELGLTVYRLALAYEQTLPDFGPQDPISALALDIGLNKRATSLLQLVLDNVPRDEWFKTADVPLSRMEFVSATAGRHAWRILARKLIKSGVLDKQGGSRNRKYRLTPRAIEATRSTDPNSE